MTVKYKFARLSGYGQVVPRRIMTAGDLGLDLLVGPYDPDLLAVGIKAPRLTAKQKSVNVAKANGAVHRPWTEERRERSRGVQRFWKTAAGKATKREVAAILQRMRFAGEVRNK